MKFNEITFIIPIFQLQNWHETNFWYTLNKIHTTTSCEIIVVEHVTISDKQYPTDAFIKRLKKFKRVRYVPYVVDTKYFSRGNTINHGVSAATTPYVWINDTDCILKFAKIIEELTDPGEFIQPAISIKDLTQQQTEDMLMSKPIRVDYNDHKTRQLQIFGAGSVICNREAFNNVLFDPEYKGWGLEDYDFFNRVSQKHDITVLYNQFGVHLWHPERMVKDGKHYRTPTVNKLIAMDPAAIQKLNSMSKKNILKAHNIKFKIYFVNLADYRERWERFKKLAQPVCDKHGYELELIDAVDTRNNMKVYEDYNLSLDPVGILAQMYFSHGAGAVGCFLSHYLIWKDIVEHDISYALALEDDADFDDVIDFLDSDTYTDVFDEYELVQINNRDLSRHGSIHPEDSVTTSTGWDGTESYLITTTGAQKMLDIVADGSPLKKVNPHPTHLWLDLENQTGKKKQVVSKEWFFQLGRDTFNWCQKNTITAAADKILGLACHPDVPSESRLKMKFVPMIDLQDHESDIVGNTKGYWQMTPGEFNQMLASRKFMHYKKDRRVIKEFKKPPTSDSIVLVAVGRDESRLLPSFIEHYEKLGVTHMIYIDNMSIDNTQEILSTQCSIDLRVVYTEDRYSENKFGLDWVHEQLLEFCKDLWCVVVDVDEFICLRYHDNLSDYIKYLEDVQQLISQHVLVEMYPGKLAKSWTGDPFTHSNYHDSFNDSEYYYVTESLDNSVVVKGGVRQRVFAHFPGPANNDSCCLVKKNIFKYTFYNTHRLSVGMHWIEPYDFVDWNTYTNWYNMNQITKYNPNLQLTHHFKFVEDDLQSYFQQRVDRGEDWNNSAEYKQYIRAMPNSFFTRNHSIKYTNKQQLFLDTVDQLTK